jgi:hypothetical protein
MELSIHAARHAARLMRKPCEPAPMLSDDGVACDMTSNRKWSWGRLQSWHKGRRGIE